MIIEGSAVDKLGPGNSCDLTGRVADSSRGRPSPLVAALAGIGAALLWAAVLAVEVARAHLSHPYSPLVDVIARWRAADGCGEASSSATDGLSTTTSWQCPRGTAVAMRVVQGGWPVWPETPTGAGGPDSFDGHRIIADLFVAHARASG